MGVYFGSFPELGNAKYVCVGNCVFGFFCYLTVNILCVCALYGTFSAVLELSILYGYDEISSYLYLPVYVSSLWVNVFGAMLGILFLKFNWYEPNWRATVLDPIRKQGLVWRERNLIFTHLCQWVLCPFDLFFVRSKVSLRKYSPDATTLSFYVFLFAFMYVCFLFYLFQTAKRYPYPIFDIVFKTWKGVGILVGGVTVLISIIM